MVLHFPSLPLPFFTPSLSLSLSSHPLEVGPLEIQLGERYELPSGIWSRASAKIEFGAFFKR